MFDIGFAELLIIGVVALLVIGPERLPQAVRTGSAWLNRLRRGFNDIKQEVQQELHNDAVMRELKDLRDTGESLRRETEAFGSDLTRGLQVPAAPGKESGASDSLTDAAPAGESEKAEADAAKSTDSRSDNRSDTPQDRDSEKHVDNKDNLGRD